MLTIEELTEIFPRDGRLEWIGLRPERHAPLAVVDSANILLYGLEGDHRSKEGARAVTLIQHEHLPAIAALAGRESVDPAMLRRNLAISGINVGALKGRLFRIGGAVLKGTDKCAPCSRMEEALGAGGYNAMRGHGGLCAAVFEAGPVRVGDAVRVLDDK
jgi:MOSC domain-containing protein YiiM